jgi:hypothetical protein
LINPNDLLDDGRVVESFAIKVVSDHHLVEAVDKLKEAKCSQQSSGASVETYDGVLRRVASVVG